MQQTVREFVREGAHCLQHFAVGLGKDKTKVPGFGQTSQREESKDPHTSSWDQHCHTYQKGLKQAALNIPEKTRVDMLAAQGIRFPIIHSLSLSLKGCQNVWLISQPQSLSFN